jgi:hypothetical protein
MKHLRLALVGLLVVGACAETPTAYDANLTPALGVFDDQETGVEVNYSFDAPSTNALNKASQSPLHVGQAAPYVEWASIEIGQITLKFVNLAPGGAWFERRIDGGAGGTTVHPVISGDVIFPNTGVPTGTAGVNYTFTANSTVEIRLALGGERDWDFDWTQFDVPNSAAARDACKDGGWETVNGGFANQGLCIRWANTAR